MTEHLGPLPLTHAEAVLVALGLGLLMLAIGGLVLYERRENRS